MKKSLTVLMACALSGAVLAGCLAAPADGGENTAVSAETIADNSADVNTGDADAGDADAEDTDTNAANAGGSGQQADDAADSPDGSMLRVGALKGPTSMGLVSLMDDADNSANQYEFTMATAADELLARMVSGDLDIALVPANVASVLYNKTGGDVSVIDINTLGVLYIVSGDTSIQTPDDLAGKTIYMTGKGTTPDYVIQYLLNAQETPVADVAFEYKSEAAEVAAVLKENPDAVGLLPQPFATVACAQNEALSMVMDLTDLLQDGSGSRLVTGVTIVRDEVLSQHEDAVKRFLSEHERSAQAAENEPERVAELVAAAGIIEKAPIAQKALPYCSITYIDGQEMKDALSGYLGVLFDQDPASVGGAMPADDFYYMNE